MNIFVLSTGRAGSTTFSKACAHLDNYTVSHGCKFTNACDLTFNYPDNHIAVDNRFVDHLNTLNNLYQKDVLYIILHRNLKEQAESLKKLDEKNKYLSLDSCEGVLSYEDYLIKQDEKIADFLYTNYELPYRYKVEHNFLDFNLSLAKDNFDYFWHLINGKGNLTEALDEWDIKYNAGNVLNNLEKR